MGFGWAAYAGASTVIYLVLGVSLILRVAHTDNQGGFMALGLGTLLAGNLIFALWKAYGR